MTGKLFEYLFAGSPVWAIGVGSDSSISDLLMQTGRGEVMGTDVRIIKEAILKVLEDDNRASKNQLNRSAKLMGYSRSEQAQRMLELSAKSFGQ